MKEYTCYTRQGKWKLTADSDMDAMRTALYYCWRDNEDFIRLEFRKGAENYTLSLTVFVSPLLQSGKLPGCYIISDIIASRWDKIGCGYRLFDSRSFLICITLDFKCGYSAARGCAKHNAPGARNG